MCLPLSGMTTMTLQRTGRRRYVLSDAAGRTRGELRLGRGCRAGTGQTGEGSWQVNSGGRRCARITAGDDLRLEPSSALLPGGAQARWEVGQSFRAYHATLRGSPGTLTVRLPKRMRGAAEIEATGEWPHRDLLALTAAFALISRRQRDRTIMLIAAVVSSHGPV